MKRKNFLQGFAMVALLTVPVTQLSAQTVTVPATTNSANSASDKELAKLRAAVEENISDLEAHKAYLKAFKSADEVKNQYDQWMKKHPTVAAIPQAIGEKYGTYSPHSAQYLLKAATLQPNNSAVWQKLALDASLRGDRVKQREYTEKAVAASPQDINLKYSYIDLFKEDNRALWKQKTFELAKQYPSEASIRALHMMGFYTKDLKEKIAIWEQLRSMFPQSNDLSFQVAMSRLGDAYILAGQYGKAIEISEAFKDKAEARLNFASKLQIARMLLEIENKMKEGNYDAARALALPMNTRSRNLLEVGSRVALVKASTLDATGATRAGYDSLITFQARTPYMDVKEVLEKYAGKLGISKDQVKKDVRAEVARNSRPAPAFELGLYTSDGTVKLENLKGKVVLLSFWYPGCGPCRAEMPHIEQAIKGIDKSKLVYLGVNGDREQDGFVLPFMKGTKYSFTPLGSTEEMLKNYGIRAYPTNFIIDQEGRIAYSGFMIDIDSEEMLEMMIQSLL